MLQFLSPKVQRYSLVGLLGVLAIITLVNWRTSPQLQIVLGADTRAQRLDIENPSLRLDLLDKIRKQEYAGTHRNIFNFSLPAPEPPRDVARREPPVEPVGPRPDPPPPDVVIPFKFYGFSSDPATGKKRGFFTNGDDIWIAAEGETVQRFRLVRIGNTTAEFEEIASGRRKTLPLDETAAPQA